MEILKAENIYKSFGENKVLKGASLTLNKGEIVSLLGVSGGGKTTTCSLLPRFYDVLEGRVTIDGSDVRDVTLASLRRTVGIVQQDVFLFADTIRENIRYGRPDATDAEVEQAARQAEIYDEICCPFPISRRTIPFIKPSRSSKILPGT